MCGIAGILSFSTAVERSHIEAMTSCVRHRGPDANGHYLEPNIALGHQRLSIIDLSEKANQPMHSANGRYVMVYNGEIYNHQEIAAELKLKTNLQFRTNSDSEVILEAFAFYGKDFVKKLNGMFAFAIYDKEQRELHLFRDRIGKKPLFYYWDGSTFVFASEMKSIAALPFVPKTLNKKGIYDFLHLGFIPNPESIYVGVKKLEAATYMKVSVAAIEINRYWSLAQRLRESCVEDETQALVKMSDLLMSSVQYQLKSDVPFGVFLSGGIDSSLVTALAANLAGPKINTFSIGFRENKYNESEYARKVAEHLKTNHHEFIVSHSDAIELVDKMVMAYDEPFADSSAIPTMLVSKLARQYVTVTLSGEGGDELFMGYGSYRWAQRLANPMVRLSRQQLKKLFRKTGSFKAANHLDYLDEDDILNNIHSQEHNYFLQRELKEMLTPPLQNQRFEVDKNIFRHLPRKLDPQERQVLFDMRYYLQDDLLTKVDRASMQFSVETRIPYLDHRVVEYALNLSPRLKFKDGNSKYILKKILYQYVPEKYFQRPKQGFAIPLQQWLKNELAYLVDEYLDPVVIKRHNVIQPQYAAELVKEFRGGKDQLYNRVWQLIILHKWMVANHAGL